MAITLAWDETKPADGRSPRLGDDDIREFKQSVKDIYRNGGHRMPAGTGPDSTTTQGRHTMGEENASSAAGTPLAGEFYFYAADGTTKIAKMTDDTAVDASVLDCTLDAGNELTIKGVNVTSGDDPGHSHATTINIPIPAAATGRVDDIIFMNKGNGVLTILSVQLVCFGAPGAGGVDMDIVEFTNDVDTDPSAEVGTSIFGTHPLIAEAKFTGAETTTFAGSPQELAVDDMLAFDVDAINGATGIVVIMKVRRA